ncbi:MAG: hypothetical protein RIE56_04695, partial [Amphiplicatus sp.]
LIQRREPKNMIGTLFLAKGTHDRAKKNNSVPQAVSTAVEAMARHLDGYRNSPSLRRAGFWPLEGPRVPVQSQVSESYWFQASSDPQAEEARELIHQIAVAARDMAPRLTQEEKSMADYAIVKEHGFPAYLGGPFALSEEIEA